MKSKSIIYILQGYIQKRAIIFYTIILMMHLVGMLGLWSSASRDLFETLTPFNLIVSVLLLFCFHKDYSTHFLVFILFTFSAGFFVEVLGVNTNLIFGNYSYGQTLGIKLWETPLLIGINWVVLVYINNYFIHKYVSSYNLIKAFLGATAMVLLDYLIEPIAIRHDFWSWANGYIPLQNYIGWFVVSFLLSLFYHQSKFDKQNNFALVLLFAQLIFFGGYNILLSIQ